MRLRTQLTAAVLATGCAGIGALLADRVVSAREVLEHRAEVRAAAVGEAVVSLVREDALEGRLAQEGRTVRSMATMPGIVYIQVFDQTGKAVVEEAGRARPLGWEGGDGAGVVEFHSALTDPGSGRVFGGVQVGVRKPSAWIDLRPLLARGAAIASLAVLALALAAWLLGRRMARRLEALADALQGADGLVPISLPDGGSNSEFDRLSRSFSRLHARLRDEALRRSRLEMVKADLTNMLVHDMKHPITVLKAVLACMDGEGPKDLSEAKRASLLRAADRAISRENGMIESLLQVARLENQEMPVSLERIELGGLLQECAESNRAVVEDSGRPWVQDLAPEALACDVLGDRSVLKRVIGNLVLNAVENTPEGTLVSLRARRMDGEGSSVEVSVRDEGQGVPQALRGVIFKKYATFAEAAKNVGLGLAFCKLAAERHLGSLELRSAAGGGADFSLLLPVLAKADADP